MNAHHPTLSRRQFLQTSTILAVGVAGASPSVSARAEGALSRRLPETIGVGIIGLDGHYSEVTETVRRLPNLQITAITVTKPEHRRRAANQAVLARAKLYEDYRKMLDEEKLDLVAECGENGARAAVVQACAEHGLPVAAEKPLALSLAELAQVKQAVNSRHVPLTMLLTMRGEPAYRALKQMVAGGQIGTVVAMEGQKSYKMGDRPEWMKHHESYGGTIPYIGIHTVDLMRWISGREFVEAAAFQSNVGAPQIGEMENTAHMIFRLDNRGSASVYLDYLRPPPAATHGDDRLRIVGTKGIAEYQAATGVTLLTESNRLTKVEDLPSAQLLFQDFVESTYFGRPHFITTEDIYRVTEIVLKTRAAAEEHRWVQL